MALSPFGKVMRKLRIDRDLLLKDTADVLGVSSAFLSAVEGGRKPAPAAWFQLLANEMKLTAAQSNELESATAQSAREFRIPLGYGTSSLAREVAAGLARNYGELDQGQLEAIRAVLDRRKKP
jgi:transcriptional regulator with XRE-family HTH domain